MSFFSTRGGSCVTASQAILQGIAPGGGLYVPAMFPTITKEKISSMVSMTYEDRAVMILKHYLEDYSLAEIKESVSLAYSQDKFDNPAIAPVREISDSTYALELFHGPTLAFKDMALQLLPHLISKACKKNNEHREVSILVATSGDTGKAALEGFKDVEGTSCTVFYPKDGVSQVQKLQMITTSGSNTHVIGLDGNFDDCQTGVKQLFASNEFASDLNSMGKVLSSANSINFGRLVPQIVYYFSAYADLVAMKAIHVGEQVNFVIPTGNFGNILAAYYAMNMGLPVGRLICASNKNRVLTDFFETGVYDARRVFFKTTSPSMDILISSNLERLLYEVADRDDQLVDGWMKQLAETGTYAIGAQRLDWLRSIFSGYSCDDRDTSREINRVFTQHRYLMDTHTAVASCALEHYRQETCDETPAVIVSTASPYKFAPDVLRSIEPSDRELEPFYSAGRLQQLSGIPVPKQIAQLRHLPVLHEATCSKENMAQTVINEFTVSHPQEE